MGRKMEMASSAEQRGYKVAGKKLAPRYYFDGFYGKSIKERRKNMAGELASYGSLKDSMPSVEFKVHKLKQGLSRRRAIVVEEAFELMHEVDDPDFVEKIAFQCFGPAQWRYFRAMNDAHESAVMRHIDEQILRNAV